MTDIRHEPLNVIPPARIARLVEEVGIAKVSLPAHKVITLAVLAGAFIALGAMTYTVVVTGADFGFGPTRLLGGLAFSLGLVLIVIGGAELFTGNALITIAWADRKVSSAKLLINWGLVYAGNLIGSLVFVAMAYWSGLFDLAGGEVGATARSIARAKVALAFDTALVRGILCNILVCLAVWLTFAAHSVPGKVCAILFPISAFIVLGFEHSVANMYLIPAGIAAGAGEIAFFDVLRNLVAVTIGNVVGGAGLVALVYWLIYIRSDRLPSAKSHDGGRQLPD